MRSLASPMVSDRSRYPLHPSHLSSPPPRGVQVPASPGAVDYVLRPASSPGGVSLQPQQRSDGSPQALHSANGWSTSGIAMYQSPARPTSQPSLTGLGSPSAPHYLVGITHPSMARSVAGNNLVRLGRAWATTTTTAGHPHPVFVDNVPRHVPFYTSLTSQQQHQTSRAIVPVGGRPRSSSVGGARRPHSAAAAGAAPTVGGPILGAVHSVITTGVATPARPKAKKPKAAARPSANIVNAYHDSLAADSQERPSKIQQPEMTDTMSSAATVEYGHRYLSN